MHKQAFRLSDLGVLRVAGADAAGFLQGQLSNDTRRLAGNHCLLAAYSTPQGRVLAVMRLVPHSTGILAILPRELIPAIRDQLKKFVLRSKVILEDASAAIVVAGCMDPAPLLGAGIRPPAAAGEYVESDGVGVARFGGTTERYWIVAQASRPRALLAADDAASATRFARDWRRTDIDEGLPQVYAATRELFVAQMLNLDLIDGISFTKGCYTGQEIIARTQHLGRIKRRMFALCLPAGDFKPGDALTLADGRSARLVDVLNDPGESRALAVIPLDGKTAVGAEAGATTGGADNDPPSGLIVPAIVSAPAYLPPA